MAEKMFTSLDRLPSESTNDSESCKEKESEGGRAAWLTVAGSILIYYASSGLMNSFGFFQDFYSHQFLQNVSVSNIAFIGTLQMALMNLLAAISGSLCDRYGVQVSTRPVLHKSTTKFLVSISTLAQALGP